MVSIRWYLRYLKMQLGCVSCSSRSADIPAARKQIVKKESNMILNGCQELSSGVKPSDTSLSIYIYISISTYV